MNYINKDNLLNRLCIILSIGMIGAALIGLFYTNGGVAHKVINIYGDEIELYGDGIYAYNSVLSVSSRLGADVAGILLGLVLLGVTIIKRSLWAKVIKASALICSVYYLIFLVFGLSMNRLFLLYVMAFGISIFAGFIGINNYLSRIKIHEQLMLKRLTGTGIFLIIAGTVTALIWISSLLPVLINGDFGSYLGIQTTEITFGLDLGVTCPLLILNGIMLLHKREIGYKIAPLSLGLLIFVAIMVVLQRIFCAKLGIDIPLPALVSYIMSFVLLGGIALYLEIKLITTINIK